MTPIWTLADMDRFSYSKLPWKTKAMLLRRFGYPMAIHGEPCKCRCHPQSLLQAYSRGVAERVAVLRSHPHAYFGDGFTFEKPRPNSW